MANDCVFKGQGECSGVVGLATIIVQACPPDRMVPACEKHAKEHGA